MVTLSLMSSMDVLHKTAETFKHKRLSLNLTQAGLAKRSGVSLGSLRRFERTGEISYYSLLALSVVLGFLDDFDKVGQKDLKSFITMEQLKADMHTRKRGRQV